MSDHLGMYWVATVARCLFADPRSTRTLAAEVYTAVAAAAGSRDQGMSVDAADVVGRTEEARQARRCRGEDEDRGCDADERYSICQIVRLSDSCGAAG